MLAAEKFLQGCGWSRVWRFRGRQVDLKPVHAREQGAALLGDAKPMQARGMRSARLPDQALSSFGLPITTKVVIARTWGRTPSTSVCQCL